ncbi:PREDICTED: leukocyte immunoglobulin-like receptor subfamily A member 5 [Ceratotherium simum simum]|uniref:Leukocyte immunoglobulin-like receptor subfamily A member 5 n=1 Tax=Ceratotherium simum simum TaxID=73337 RepID=A0ABM1DD07_CERSS|nr:PREDICTED: leukocyte immunoglobulin-like receptor subfamily A member 5 [Ceratotherium simum simum]
MSLVLPTLLCLCESGREGPSYKYKATGGRAAGSRRLSCLTCCFLPGLYPGQCTQAQNRNLPRPDITAVPESMVLSKEQVTIQCQGPAEATAYAISKVGSPERSHTEKQLLSKTTNTLEIAQMTPHWAGLYHCSYQSGDSWSQFSDPLQLVMTGAYEKPSLSSMTGTVVASGENVKLQCFSRLKFDVFILIEEDEVHAIQNQSSTPKGGGHQAVFLLNQVSSTQAGTYRCFGVFNDSRYVWSDASDPLQLQVRGEEAPAHPSSCLLLRPTLSRWSSDWEKEDSGVGRRCHHRLLRQEALRSSLPSPTMQPSYHMPRGRGSAVLDGKLKNIQVKERKKTPLISAPFAEAPEGPDPTTSRHSTAPPSNKNSPEKHQNVLIGVPVAIALLLLVLLLLFIIHRRKAKSNAARSDRQLEAAGPMDGQASEARDPQDVTYSQVTSSVSTQGTAATPSLLPRQTQTSEYATLALR